MIFCCCCYCCRCILYPVIHDNEEDFSKIVALLENFGLVYDLRRSSDQNVFLVPWYLPEKSPSKVDTKDKVRFSNYFTTLIMDL